MTHRRRRSSRGFTLLELLMVVVIISILTFIAYPAMQTFAGRNKDVNAASYVTRTFNKARDQARRRNRAVAVQFTNFSAAQPQGLIILREGFTNSCLDLADSLPDNSQILTRLPFGEEDAGDGADLDFSGREEDVGLANWRFSNVDDNLDANDLTLCVSPDGAVAALAAGGLTPVDRVRVNVQKFDREQGGGWDALAPPRAVEISFAGGARLAVGS